MPLRPYLKRTLTELGAEDFLDATSSHAIDLMAIAEGAPTSAERQRAIFDRTGSLDEVTRSVATEFEDDVLSSTAAG